MSIKGYPSIKKLITIISGYTDAQSKTTNEFITAQKTSSDKVALDVAVNGAFRVNSSAKLAEVGSTSAKRILKSTAHGALPGDVIRFELGSANPFFEAGISSVPDANTIILATELPNNIVPVTDTFFILRHVTPAYSSDGTSQSSSGPVQYNLNGTNTTVTLDTVTPGNSRPLPVVNLNIDGTRVDVATSALQTANNVLIGAVTETAPASDTASSGLNGRLQRVAQRITSLIALLPASIGQKAKTGALAVTLASDEDLLSRLPATLGQKADAASLAMTLSTEGTAQLGSLTETAPASDTASSGLNGRLQRIAQRLTSLIALFPVSIGQKTSAGSLSVTLASDFVNSQPSVVSTANSSVATLGISAVFTGTSEQVQDYATIQVTVFTDQASAALGLSMQQSSNGTNWDITDVYTVPITAAGQGKIYSIAPAARFFRIVYTNGGAANTVFRLQTVYHYQAAKSSSHSLADTITLQNDAELVIAQQRATNGTNSVALTAQATGEQNMNSSMINGVAVLAGAGATGTGSQRVTTANVAAATLANVASSATNVTLLASGAARMGATFWNDSTSILYLKLGATASTTSCTVKIQPDGYYELPQPCYSGIIDGIWSSANGFCRVTSW